MNWLMRLVFRLRFGKTTSCCVSTDDALMRAAEICFELGKPIIGHIDQHGNITVGEVGGDDETKN